MLWWYSIYIFPVASLGSPLGCRISGLAPRRCHSGEGVRFQHGTLKEAHSGPPGDAKLHALFLVVTMATNRTNLAGRQGLTRVATYSRVVTICSRMATYSRVVTIYNRVATVIARMVT